MCGKITTSEPMHDGHPISRNPRESTNTDDSNDQRKRQYLAPLTREFAGCCSLSLILVLGCAFPEMHMTKRENGVGGTLNSGTTQSRGDGESGGTSATGDAAGSGTSATGDAAGS